LHPVIYFLHSITDRKRLGCPCELI